ncbi:MAG: PadR family transcriptional regulator [Thermomicrobiales bacterium]|nr:PadR family transcriptional regulator [Thermomicrobiales bacterium]
MPAEHALLGLLALTPEAQPGHGYDLARRFAGGQPLGDVLRLEPGMLYHHLKKLERAGWVAAATEPQPARPARRTFRLTASGRAELTRWLGEPVTHTREIRLEFLVKLYFVRALIPERLPHLLAGQRDVLSGHADSLMDQIATLTEPEADAAAIADVAYQRLVLELRLAQTRAAIAWLDRATSSAPIDDPDA